MTMFQLLCTMAKNKMTHQSVAKPFKNSNVPYKLHQNTLVEISPAPFIIAEALGSKVPAVASNTSVTAVGTFSLFGMSVHRSYLSDGRSFIQTVSKNDFTHTCVECRLYTMQKDEYFPQSNEEWDYLLNENEGYIGSNSFGIQVGDENIYYPRLWSPGNNHTAPIVIRETVHDAHGNSFWAKHTTMQYGRCLGTENDPAEYLLPSVTETNDGASFMVWIGLDLDATMFNVAG